MFSASAKRGMMTARGPSRTCAMADKSGPVLGIDLGTTNSVVAVADGSEARVLTDAAGNHLVPSVVSFIPTGGSR